MGIKKLYVFAFLIYFGSAFCIDVSDIEKGIQYLSDQGDSQSKFHYSGILGQRLSIEREKSKAFRKSLLRESLLEGCWQSALLQSYSLIDNSVGYMYIAIASEFINKAENNLSYAKRIWGVLEKDWEYQGLQPYIDKMSRIAAGSSARSSGYGMVKDDMQKEKERQAKHNILQIHDFLNNSYAFFLEELKNQIRDLERNCSEEEIEAGIELAKVWMSFHSFIK